MFKDIYKSANDSIKAGDELVKSVLTRKRRRSRSNGYIKYASAAAAVFIIAAGIAAIPVLDKNDTGVIYEVRETDSPIADMALSIVPSEKPEEPRETQKEPSESNQKSETWKVPEAKKVSGAEKEPLRSEEQKSVEKPAKQETVVTAAGDTAEDTAEDEAIIEPTVNTSTISVVLSVNSEDYGGYDAAESINGEYYDYGGNYTETSWTLADYFNYLGVDVLSRIQPPAGFEYCGGGDMQVMLNEEGIPSLDSRIFPYSSPSGYITVMTSRDNLSANSRISDSRYQKSDICGVPAVVIGGDGSYKCYIISDGVSYIITASGTDENGLGAMLLSIVG